MSLYQSNLIEDQGLLKKFECKISGFEVGTSVETELKKLQSEAHLKGFRKGKAPMNIIQDYYFGKVFYDIINKIASQAVQEIATENSFTPAIQPKVEIDADSNLPKDRNIANISDVIIKITYEIFPDVTNFDFSNIKLEKFALDVTNEMIEKEIEQIAKNNSTKEEKSTKIENGDIATIDFTGYKDGEKFQGGEDKDYTLEIGSKTFIDGFESGLIGFKTNEETTLKLKFPDEYHDENLKGQDVEFKVTIKKVEKQIPAEINDSLAQNYGFENLEALKEDVKKNIINNYNDAYKAVNKLKVFKEIKSLLNFDVPPSLKPQEGEKYEEEMESLKFAIFFHKYANENNIQVTNEDYMQHLSTIAKMYDISPKFLFDIYSKDKNTQENIHNMLFEQKVYNKIYETIPSNIQNISKEKFDEIIENIKKSQKDIDQDSHIVE